MAIITHRVSASQESRNFILGKLFLLLFFCVFVWQIGYLFCSHSEFIWNYEYYGDLTELLGLGISVPAMGNTNIRSFIRNPLGEQLRSLHREIVSGISFVGSRKYQLIPAYVV
jgi:hypothetical protein